MPVVIFPPETEVKTNHTSTLSHLYGLTEVTSSVYLAMLLTYLYRTSGNYIYIYWTSKSFNNEEIAVLTYTDLEAEYNKQLSMPDSTTKTTNLKTLARLLRLHKKGFVICII